MTMPICQFKALGNASSARACAIMYRCRHLQRTTLMESEDLKTLIDAYAEKREARLKLDCESGELKKDEDAMANSIAAALRDGHTDVGMGRIFSVTRWPKQKTVVHDWREYHNYIKANDAFDLLEKRVGQKAASLRWEDGVKLPGAELLIVDELKVSRI